MVWLMEKFAESPPVEVEVGEALEARDETIATAESCTGGLIGALLTEVPGSSAYYDRSVVTYSVESKMELLAVERGALEEHGAVSQPVARMMAEGVRDTAGTTWGVSTTGVAGPTRIEEADVGEVYVGVAFAGEWGEGETYSRVEHHEFSGSRWEVKELMARQALHCVLDEVGTRVD